MRFYTYRPNRFSAYNQQGVTLVEIMISMFVMTLVLLGVFASVQKSFDLVSTQRDLNRAAAILQNEIDTLRVQDWSGFKDISNSTSSYETTLGLEEKFPEKYKISRLVVPENSGEQLAVTFSVTWDDLNGNSQSVSYFTKWWRK